MAQYSIGQRYRGSGVEMPGIAGETVPRGAAVFMSAVDGLWYLADSDAAATLPAVGIVSDAGAAGQIIQILVLGLIERSDWTWTRGDSLYASGTAGVMTQVAPANAQSIAVAITATLIYVNTTLAIFGAGGVGAHVLATTGPHTNTLPLTDLAVGAQGEIIHRSAADWAALAVGAAGQILMSGGPGADVSWAPPGGVGTPNDQFFAAPDPDGYIGPYASMSMLDGVDTIVRQTFRLPNNWSAAWGVSLVVIPAATGNLRRTITTNFCAAGEVYNTHVDAIAAGIQAVTLNEQELIDITAALTGAAAGDLVGVEYLRDALTSAADTVAATVHYIGVLLTEA